MTDEIEYRVPTRLLTKRFVLLWTATCAGRLIYMLEPLSKVTLRPLLELTFLAFLLLVSTVEIMILRKAAADYKDSIQLLRPVEFSETVKLSAIYPLLLKLIIGFLMFGLISVLWDTRNDNQMIIPTVLGVAMNLWWVWMFTAPRISLNKPLNR